MRSEKTIKAHDDSLVFLRLIKGSQLKPGDLFTELPRQVQQTGRPRLQVTGGCRVPNPNHLGDAS